MLTPPYHFNIVACASASTPPGEILYRGAIPVERNIPFISRLNVRTLVYLRKKELKPHEPLVAWTAERGIELKWIKAETMKEEKLGMGKTEVGEVLKVILDRTAYPLYVADIDGVSHTTLVMACLRKMQGWHIDSIIGEMCRFQPEYEDYSIVSFITSYLTGPDASFALPPPPYPTWLWPAAPSALALTRTITRERANTSTTAAPTSSHVLPFPHPLQSRKHPTMKLNFSLPTTTNVASPLSPSAIINNPLSRVGTRGERGDEENRPAPSLASSATSTVHAGINGATSVIPHEDESGTNHGPAGFAASTISAARTLLPSPAGTSPDKPATNGQDTAPPAMLVPPNESLEADELELEEDEEEYEEDEEEEEDDDDDDLQPTSQYISALDLAGY